MTWQSLTILLPKQLSRNSRGLSLWLRSVVREVHQARMVARQRRRLAQLDDRQLQDIGISRVEALKESSRSFWDIPEHLK